MFLKTKVLESDWKNFSRQSDKIRKMLEKKSSEFWVKSGEKQALYIFKQASKRVPAYKDFLHKYKVNPDKIITISDFSQVPTTDKESYISKYSLEDLAWDGDIASNHIVVQSSGTMGGKPFFWLRNKKNDLHTGILHDLIFKKAFNINKKSTLFVVCFHLGPHIAGMITTDSIRQVLAKGVKGTLVTPGLSKSDTIHIVKDLSSYYEQTILIGYPPHIKDIVKEGSEKGIDWSKLNVNFMFSGESFPESWRDNLLELSGGNDNTREARNIYGSADVGLMGHESELTINIRKILNSVYSKETEKLKSLFAENFNTAPSVYQFHTWNKYFESIKNELHVTAGSGIPLIRYNMHDIGSVVSYKEVEKIKPEIKKEDHWKLPFVTVLGRNNYSVTIYALNVFPEHIRECLSENTINKFVTGKFFMETKYDEKQDQYFEISIELCEKVDFNKNLEEKLITSIVKTLCQVNLEYNKLYQEMGLKVAPKIKAYSFESEEFKSKKMKRNYFKN